MSAGSAATATRAVASAVAARPLRLVDVGVNLLDPMFRGIYRDRREHPDDFPAVLQRARDFHVASMIITAGTAQECVQAAQLAREIGCFSTAGCHPTRGNEWHGRGETRVPGMTPEQYLKNLKAVIEQNRDVIVAVGECGLDYDRLHFCAKQTQLEFFPPQILVAAEFRLPLFLHDRNTGDDFFAICTAHAAEIRAAGGGVVHSFTGTAEHLERLLALGVYISVNGCSFKEEWQLDVARRIPLNRLLLETDAPWCQIKPTHAAHRLLAARAPLADEVRAMLPREPAAQKPDKFQAGLPVRSRCEPFELGRVLQVMYCLRSDELAGGPFQLAEMVWANTVRLFGDRFGAKPAAPAAKPAAAASA